MRCEHDATGPPDRSSGLASEAESEPPSGQQPQVSRSSSTIEDIQTIVDAEVANTIGALSDADLKRHAEYLETNPGRIHSDIDRGTCAGLRNRLDRDLTTPNAGSIAHRLLRGCVTLVPLHASANNHAHDGRIFPCAARVMPSLLGVSGSDREFRQRDGDPMKSCRKNRATVSGTARCCACEKQG